MYCNNCGKKAADTNKYCKYCGKKLIKTETTISPNFSETNSGVRQQKKSESDYPEFDIPGITGSQKLNFTIDSLLYGGKTIKYQDITGISCKQIYHSTNLIPTHQEFSFSFYSENKRINVNFGTTLHIGAKNRKEIFTKLYLISKSFFVPIIVEKLVTQIIKENKIIKIGNVYFDKNGYYKKKLFGGEEWVHWNDSISEPRIESGSIILYKADGDKYRNFADISLDNINAIAVPDLLTALYTISCSHP